MQGHSSRARLVGGCGGDVDVRKGGAAAVARAVERAEEGVATLLVMRTTWQARFPARGSSTVLLPGSAPPPFLLTVLSSFLFMKHPLLTTITSSTLKLR